MNPEKYNILYRIQVENYYAEQSKLTICTDRGRMLYVDNPNVLNPSEVIIKHDSLGQISETKIIRPLTKTSVRVMAGDQKEARLGNPTVNELIKGAMILTMDESGDVSTGRNVTITPYGTIQIEQMDDVLPLMSDGSKWNIYREERVSMADNRVLKLFYLRYRYRTLIVDDYYTDWTYVTTTLRKQE